jgi:hypothetical protein
MAENIQYRTLPDQIRHRYCNLESEIRQSRNSGCGIRFASEPHGDIYLGEDWRQILLGKFMFINLICKQIQLSEASSYNANNTLLKWFKSN